MQSFVAMSELPWAQSTNHESPTLSTKYLTTAVGDSGLDLKACMSPVTSARPALHTQSRSTLA